MKALILSAGMGSRLKPHTDTQPKALVKVGGVPMLVHVAEKLIGAGVDEIVVNIHHHADQMRAFIKQLNYPGVRFYVSDETAALLDTGGAIKKAASLLRSNAPFFIHNVDVLSNINLPEMLAYHQKTKALATLAVSRRKSSRGFLWSHGRLCGWRNTDTGEEILLKPSGRMEATYMPFSGIHLADAAFLDNMAMTGRFSVKDSYLQMANHHPIMAFEHDHAGWADIGSPEKLQRAEVMFGKANEHREKQ